MKTGARPEGGVKRVGLVDQAADRFREEVVSGRWPVGEKIPTEPELVEQFGIGRNTVREAIQSLVHTGLLSREQGRGTFVISNSELGGALERQLAGGTRRDYLELRRALDSAAASLAAANRTKGDAERLRELRDRRREVWDDVDAHERAVVDLELHQAIVEATRNPLFVKLYEGMLEVFAAHMSEDDIEDEESAHGLHHELVEAIVDGDPELAAAKVADIFKPFMP